MIIHKKDRTLPLIFGLTLLAVGLSHQAKASHSAEEESSEGLPLPSPTKMPRQSDASDIRDAMTKKGTPRDIPYKLEDLDVQSYCIPLSKLIEKLQAEKEKTTYIQKAPKDRVRLSTIRVEYETILRKLKASEESLELLVSQKEDVQRRVNLLKADLDNTPARERTPIFESIRSVYADVGYLNGKAFYRANAASKKIASSEIESFTKLLKPLRSLLDNAAELTLVSHVEVLRYISRHPTEELCMNHPHQRNAIQKALTDYFPE